MTERTATLGSFLTPVTRDEPVNLQETYAMLGVRSFGMGAFATAPLSGDTTSYSTLRKVADGDVVYPKLMAWEGAFALVPPALSERWVSPEFCVFIVDEAKADRRYVSQLLSWEGLREGLLVRSSGTNARRRRLQPTDFLRHRVPFPEVPEQHRIATHLTNIQNTVDKIRTSRRSPWEALDSALDELEWNYTLRSLLLEDSDEVEVKADHRYHQIGVFGGGRGVIDRGSFLGSSTKYTKMLRVRSGQVVVSRLKAFEGAVAIVPERHNGALVSKEFPTFSLADDVDPQFVQAILRSPRFTDELRSKSVGLGARRERVDAARFLSITVPVPPTDVQRAIGGAARLAGRARALQLRSDRLAAALLPAARNEVFSSLR